MGVRVTYVIFLWVANCHLPPVCCFCFLELQILVSPMRGVPGEIPFLIRYIWDPLGITHDRYILSESPGNVVCVHAGTANAPVFPRHGDLQAAGLPAYQLSIILFFFVPQLPCCPPQGSPSILLLRG